MAAKYYSGRRQGKATLSTSYASIVTGGTYGSDVRRLVLVNTGSTDRIVTFADETSAVIDSIVVPANAGLTGTLGTTVPSVDALNDGVPIGGSELDAYQNRYYSLASASYSLYAKQDTGTDIQVQYSISDYGA